MKFQRRLKRSTKQYMIVSLISIVVIGGAASVTSVIITGQIKGEYQTLLNAAYQDMKENQRIVYVAATDIYSGDIITKEMIEKKNVYSSQPQDSYITENEIGRTAIVGIPTGTQIIDTMISENDVSEKLRETEYQVINMNSNILTHDTVDIRIFYPNGESYVVLAKKEIKAYIPETVSVYFWLEEDELLRMSAAIVDAALYPGAKLSVTKYIEPNIQDESVITYVPSISILSLIENDPNICERSSQELNKEVRKALENRLAGSMANDVSTINWEVDTYDTFITDTEETSDNNESQYDEVAHDIEADEDKITQESDIMPSEAPANSSVTKSIEGEYELGCTDDDYFVVDDSYNEEIEYGE